MPRRLVKSPARLARSSPRRGHYADESRLYGPQPLQQQQEQEQEQPPPLPPPPQPLPPPLQEQPLLLPPVPNGLVIMVIEIGAAGAGLTFRNHALGCQLDSVAAGSVADHAGFEAGDVIVAVDERPVRNLVDVANVFNTAGEYRVTFYPAVLAEQRRQREERGFCACELSITILIVILILVVLHVGVIGLYTQIYGIGFDPGPGLWEEILGDGMSDGLGIDHDHARTALAARLAALEGQAHAASESSWGNIALPRDRLATGDARLGPMTLDSLEGLMVNRGDMPAVQAAAGDWTGHLLSPKITATAAIGLYCQRRLWHLVAVVERWRDGGRIASKILSNAWSTPRTPSLAMPVARARSLRAVERSIELLHPDR